MCVLILPRMCVCVGGYLIGGVCECVLMDFISGSVV